MHLEIKLFTLALLLSSVFTLVTAYYLLRKRDSPGVVYFSALAFISIIWYTGYIIELNTTTLSQKFFAVRLQYFLGIPFTPALCYIASRHFTSQKKHPGLTEIIIVSIIPVVTILSVWTSQYHSLFYKDIALERHGGINFFTKVPGPLYYVHIYYSYSLVLCAAIVLFINFIKSSGVFKRQSGYYLLVLTLPFAASLIFVGRYFTGYLFDITPICYAIAIILIGYDLQKYGMPELLYEAKDIVMKTVNTGIIVTDESGRIIEINQAAEKLFNRRENLGRYISETFRNANIRTDLAAAKNGDISEIEIEPGYFEVSVISINGRKDKREGKIFAFYDITERRNKENNLKELNTAKDRLFSIIAHDLKNPMYGMMGISELLYEDFNDLGNDEKIGFIKDINELSFNTHKMLESLLDWSRQQTGKVDYLPNNIDVSAILRRNILSSEKQAGLKNIKITSFVAEDIFIFADENMIDTVIRNLISNAIKFTNNGGEIKVFAEKHNSMAEVTIADNGVGMSEENCKKLFRIDNTYKSNGTAGEKGTGLGLLLCKEFVEKNNGIISVTSRPGDGTAFSFTVPLSVNNNL
jgi:signal transduction histidine kinase